MPEFDYTKRHLWNLSSNNQTRFLRQQAVIEGLTTKLEIDAFIDNILREHIDKDGKPFQYTYYIADDWS